MSNPFCQYARPLIKGFLSTRGESLRWLAKQTKVDYHRVYRIDTGEIKTVPFPDARRLLQFLEPSTADDTLRQFYPVETTGQSGQLNSESQDLQDSLFQAALESEGRWKIFLHVTTKSGCTKADIKDQFGVDGLGILSELISIGVISVSSDYTLLSNIDRDLTPSVVATVKEARMQIGALNFDSSGGYLRSVQRRYSKEGCMAVYKAITGCADTLRRIDNDPTYLGDRLYVYTIALGTLRGGERHED
ncbi:MAG TPA: hypothetical protein VE954_34430 [Oligoflexus sp.]|uniref:hypothetical protein n=1 Tax=Oligoflexus sp. TaxID=1971216 RepID=UPI002D2DA540|nr:hypothetical protein [Oligoflexus sp.]HYX38227.1 hypothetical protein [Oligoflexus sp.]